MAGFVLGFAIGIIVNQAPTLFGLPGMPGSYVQQLWGTIQAIPDTSAMTLLVGAASLGMLLGMRVLVPRWPRALVVMTLAIAAASTFDLADHGVAVTGDIPTGLFSVGVPGIGLNHVGTLLVGALSVVFVGYSESLAAGRRMAIKHRYELDQDQELIAQGMANAAAGLVGGFVVDGSLSKTAVADSAGQRTEMASLINAAFVLLTMLVLASLFEDLPAATLGAVVIDAMVGLITFRDLKRYHEVNRPDWLFFMGAMIGILTFGIIAGILVGVVLSLLLLIARSSRPTVPRLGRDPASHAYHDIDRIEGLQVTAGVLITRIDGPLFFADADRFRTRMRAMTTAEPGLRAVIVDASAVYLTDTDGADILIQVAGEVRADGTSLVLAHVHPGTLALWRRAGVIDAIGADNVFETVGEAERAWTLRTAETEEGR
jgi:MFS superfamily sulfate permease-like transporter